MSKLPNSYTRENNVVTVYISDDDSKQLGIVVDEFATRIEGLGVFDMPKLSKEQYTALRQRADELDMTAYNALMVITSLEAINAALYLLATKYPEALDEKKQLRPDWLERMVGLLE